MNCLVTGGAGFIGSHLVEALLKKGHRVMVLDNLSTGSLRNLTAVRKHPRLEFHRGSVLSKTSLAPLIKKSDQIFHLAAAVGVKLVVEKPLQSLLTNLEGTKNVLELAARRGCMTLIASTSEVYGKNPRLPFREDADRVYGAVERERWGYALAKAVDELMAILYYREHDLPVVVARYFNTTGPRQSSAYGMVVPTFVRQALSGKPITVHGDGRQFRSFSYVDDVVRGTLLLMNNRRAHGQVFNLGAGQPVTINSLARRVKQLTHSLSPIVHIPYEKAYNKNFEDMRGRVPDIGKARRLVGYEPKYKLDDILRATVAYHLKLTAKASSQVASSQ